MLTIRPATVADAVLIQTFITELAEYESEPEQVRITDADIARDGFGADPQFRVLIAEWSSEPVGFALFFHYYSTWRGAARDCIWKICSCVLNFGGAASAPRCLPALPVQQRGRIALSFAGRYSIGMHARSGCIGRWKRIFWMSGARFCWQERD
jgi:hypothetical protein